MCPFFFVQKVGRLYDYLSMIWVGFDRSGFAERLFVEIEISTLGEK